jgi:hypothetical protein
MMLPILNVGMLDFIMLCVIFLTLNVAMPDVVMLNGIFFNTEYCDAGCHYAERHILDLY